MKKVCTYILLIAIILSTMTTLACATNNEEPMIDLGDGFNMLETATTFSLWRSGDMVYGSKSGKVYQGSTLVGSATLNAAFDISGSTAKAVDAFMDGTGSNGGTYLRGTASCSRNTASGTAYFDFSGLNKTVRLSISCSPDGKLS